MTIPVPLSAITPTDEAACTTVGGSEERETHVVATPGLLGPVEAEDVQLHGGGRAVQRGLHPHKPSGGVAGWGGQDTGGKGLVHGRLRHQHGVVLFQVRVLLQQLVRMLLLASYQPHSLHRSGH